MEEVMSEVYGPWRTGVTWRPKAFSPDHSHMGRYLWTDAFGVMNFLTLFRETNKGRYLQQACTLVEEVHNTLGRTRDGAARLPRASDDHPTCGGLRIGKAHDEGHPDGDGQYFHYLTKWALALASLGLAAQQPQYVMWAVELVEGVHDAFLQGGQALRTSRRHGASLAAPKALAWKMSIDLKHAAVPSSGNLDPFDGLVTYRLLQTAAQHVGAQVPSGGAAAGPQPLVLQRHVNDMREMVEAKYLSYHSEDPLDLGESLWLSHWQLGRQLSDHRGPRSEPWAAHVATVALQCLEQLWDLGYFEQPLSRRLAFREFGTTLGLQAVLRDVADLQQADEWRQRVARLHQAWEQHLYTRDRDITPVMYCASLVPGVWLSDNWHDML